MLHTRDDWDAAVETFNGQVIMAYQNTDLFGTDKMMFDGRPMGETVNYPVMQNMIARNEDDGLDVLESPYYGRQGQFGIDPALGSAGDAADVSAGSAAVLPEADVQTRRVEVDPVLKENRLIPRDQITVRPELKLPENYALKLGRAIAEGKHIRLQNMLAAIAVAAGNNRELPGSFGGGDADGQAIKELINAIAAEMDEAGVPNDDGGRHIFLKSTHWYSLLGVPGMITKEYGGQANVQRPGQVILYANFQIHNARIGMGPGADYTTTLWSNLLVGPPSDPTKYLADMTTTFGVVWHREAWALRHWENPNTDIDWVSLRNSYKVESRLMMGAESIQDVGIYTMEDAGTT